MQLSVGVPRALLRLSPSVRKGIASVQPFRRRDCGIAQARSRGLSALEELEREKQQEMLDQSSLIGLSQQPVQPLAHSRNALVDRIAYERPLKIVSYPDPRLRAPNARIKLPAEGIEQLAADMFDIMYSDDGIGLAAPQIGVNVQMMVFNPEGPPAKGDPSKEVVLINPRILKTGRDTAIEEEGCLSFYHPLKVHVDVERALSVKIKAVNLKGEKVTMTLNGLPARIFQHEFDHLQGILFFQRLSPEWLQKITPLLHRYEEEYLQRNPDVEIKRFFS